MLGIIIILALILLVETIILAEVLYHSKHPYFIFEIDDHDPMDLKLALHSKNDYLPIPGRVYFLKAVRK